MRVDERAVLHEQLGDLLVVHRGGDVKSRNAFDRGVVGGTRTEEELDLVLGPERRGDVQRSMALPVLRVDARLVALELDVLRHPADGCVAGHPHQLGVPLVISFQYLIRALLQSKIGNGIFLDGDAVHT